MPGERETKKDEGHDGHKPFEFFVDDKPYSWPKPEITGAEVMEVAEIPPADGLLLCLEDGTQRRVKAAEEIKLRGRGPQFRKPPRFKRG